MPNSSNNDSDELDPYSAVLAELSKLYEEWRHHRDVVNRSITLLAGEIFRFDRKLEQDNVVRSERQVQVDAKFEEILVSLDKTIIAQNNIKRWQWIRIGFEVSAILIVLAFVLGQRL